MPNPKPMPHYVNPPRTIGYMVAHDPTREILRTEPAALHRALEILKDNPDYPQVGIARVEQHMLVG